jgi:uncharacterized protein
MNNKWLYLMIILFVFVSAIILSIYILSQGDSGRTGTVVLESGFEIDVEVADTQLGQINGLSNKESLEDDAGMLFVFNRPSEPSFWMKDMLFAIDIIWINNNRIIGYDKNLQPEYPAKTHYSPKFPINSVLEVRAGFVEKHGLKIGDELDISL